MDRLLSVACFALVALSTPAGAGLTQAPQAAAGIVPVNYHPATGSLFVNTEAPFAEFFVEAPAGSFTAERFDFAVGTRRVVGDVFHGPFDVAAFHVDGDEWQLPPRLRLDSLLIPGTPADALTVEFPYPGLPVEEIGEPTLGFVTHPAMLPAVVVTISEPASAGMAVIGLTGCFLLRRCR